MQPIKTKIVELPTFEQLTPKEQEKVIETYRDINTDDFSHWYINTYDDFQNSDNGYFSGIDDIHFTGFWSQGDGASFDTADIDWKGYVKEFKEIYPTLFAWGHSIELDISICKNSYATHYCHSNTRYISIESDMPEKLDYVDSPANKELNRLEDAFTAIYRGLCNDLYRKLQSDYEYHTSDEAVKETLINNEYTFNRETLKIDD